MRHFLAFLLFLLMPLTAWSADEPARSVEDLIRGMESANYQIRRKAVLAAEGRDEPALLERLLVLAAGDGNPNIRAYAAEVLGSYRDERIFPLLLELTKTDRFPSPRHSAYESMGRLGDARAWVPLRAALAVRDAAPYAARGLAHGGRTEAWDAICAAYLRDIDYPYAAELIPQALFDLDPARAETFLLSSFADVPAPSLHTVVRHFRDHPSPAVRTRMQALVTHEVAATRRGAIQVLGTAGDAGTVDLLSARLDADPEDRVYVVRSLGEIGDPRAAPRLEGVLKTAASGGERAALAEALGRLGRATSVEPLVTALDAEEDPFAKVVQIHALALLGDAAARPAIARRVADETASRQPRTISSVWTFPWNVRVSAAALWALRALDEGGPPFPVEDLSVFPSGGPSDWERGARARLDAGDR